MSPVYIVPKKEEMVIIKNENSELILSMTVTGWHKCIDYRKLNKATCKDHFSFPLIDQMLERLAKNSYLCYLDGHWGFRQILIHPSDQDKTIFAYLYGTFAYRRMPSGLRNAPTMF